jgi:alanine dehydrogenase
MGNCCQHNQNIHKHSIPAHYYNDIELYNKNNISIDELKSNLFPNFYSDSIHPQLITVSLDHTIQNTIQNTIHYISDKFTDDEDELPNEFHQSQNNNQPHQFQDIIDNKHNKYMTHYQYTDTQSELFWGIGVENETYLMFSSLLNYSSFKQLNYKRERYSVDYYKNFKNEPLQPILQTLKTLPKLTYPIYINAHTFDKTDIHSEHKTFYDEQNTPNPKFIESLHQILLKESPYYQSQFDQSFVFDGDTFEFITQQFYNSTSEQCVNELISTKYKWLQEISPFLQKWNMNPIQFPDHNYGLVSFLTTYKKNISICNTGTYHINITLPSYLQNGILVDKNKFSTSHLNFIKMIQMVEPIIVACYGTPDIFSLLDPSYSIGSLRVSRSRYISLHTFNADLPINGKLLLMKKPDDPLFWYNLLNDSPYELTNEIGYDINFNKFKNHGVEIRFLDWFPEQYLKALIDFFILLAQHSLSFDHLPFNKSNYSHVIKNCIHKGFTHLLSIDESNIILSDLQLPLITSMMTAFDLLNYINDILYSRYVEGEIIQRMSPNMKKPELVNYNKIAFQKLYQDLFSKPDLILRAENNPLEFRTPIIPLHLSSLSTYFNIIVEKSLTRCYTDEEYEKNGASLISKDDWIHSRYSFIIGLKEINLSTHHSHTLLHFAHCFKNQPNYRPYLKQLENSTFIDYEFLLDSQQNRVISFCRQSGKIGCYLALMAYVVQVESLNKFPEFNEEIYLRELKRMYDWKEKPKILLIGFGKVGKSCKEVLDLFDLDCTIWRKKDKKDKNMLLDHHIVINAISLSEPFESPFLTIDDLDLPRKTSVICDISCDLGNPNNTIPIYNQFTTKDNPINTIKNCPRLDVISINNLPSLQPILSSFEFSTILSIFLPELLYFKYTKKINNRSDILYRSYEYFLKMCSML